MVNDNHYAVVIGLNNYTNGLSQLKGAANDARKFEQWLISQSDRGGKLPKENVYSRIDVAPDTVTFQNIKRTLTDAIALTPLVNQEGLRERLYIYMAGHGISLDDISLVRSDASALLTLECAQQDLSSHIAEYTIRKMSSRLGWYKEVVIVMDCCREETGKSSLCAFWNDPRRNDLLDEEGFPRFYTYFATKPKGLAREVRGDDGKYYGVFTESFLRNIQGAVDEENRVTHDSLKRVILNDFKENPNFDNYPIPQIKGDAEPLVYSVSGQSLTSTLYIRFDELIGTDSELLIIKPDNSEAKIGVNSEASPICVNELLPGKYTVRVLSGSGELLETKSINVTSGETRTIELSEVVSYA